MITGIRAAIRRLIERHIVTDDPMPERSWLDVQDMPRVQEHFTSAVAGLPVEPLPPLADSRAGHGMHPQPLRRRPRGHIATMHRGDGG